MEVTLEKRAEAMAFPRQFMSKFLKRNYGYNYHPFSEKVKRVNKNKFLGQ